MTITEGYEKYTSWKLPQRRPCTPKHWHLWPWGRTNRWHRWHRWHVVESMCDLLTKFFLKKNILKPTVFFFPWIPVSSCGLTLHSYTVFRIHLSVNPWYIKMCLHPWPGQLVSEDCLKFCASSSFGYRARSATQKRSKKTCPLYSIFSSDCLGAKLHKRNFNDRKLCWFLIRLVAKTKQAITWFWM